MKQCIRLVSLGIFILLLFARYSAIYLFKWPAIPLMIDANGEHVKLMRK
jgi:hypothetical protein